MYASSATGVTKDKTEFPSDDGAAAGDRRELFFPRRAVMYVPASDERKVKKVASISVDSIVFDMEDGVAMNQKVVQP